MTETWAMEAGRRLAALRARRGWTQAALADRAGCSRQTIVAVEGGHWPSPAVREGLARAVGVGAGCLAEYLLGHRPMPEVRDE